MTVLTLLTYGSYKVTRLVNSEDYNVGMHILEDHFASNATFGAADGFVVSAAVTSYDGSSEDITDPEIGEIKFYLKHWDVSANSTETIQFTELEHKLCQSEDFSFRDDDTKSDISSKFYTVKE